MQNKYEVLGIVGEGAYGIVMKCRNKETNEIVAIKKFKDGEEEIVQKSMLRELKVLKKLRHENIVQLKESFRRKGKLYLVFEYVDRNLLEILEQYPNGLDQQLVKRFIYQLCKSIIYIHNNDMIHRDIKPENILITNDLNVKVCDFGFTRSLPQKGGILTDYVATRWYRAPELLLGCSNYGKEIDFWAVGCIMGEITDGKAMFPSENELEQLYMIQKLLGSLPQNMLEIFSANPRFGGYKMENVLKPETLERKYYGKLNKQAFSFLKLMLKLDPRERITGNEVLMHPYFDEIRNEDPEFAGGNNICNNPANNNVINNIKQVSNTINPCNNINNINSVSNNNLNNLNSLNNNSNSCTANTNLNIIGNTALGSKTIAGTSSNAGGNINVKSTLNQNNNANNTNVNVINNQNKQQIINNNNLNTISNKNINTNNLKEDDLIHCSMNATQKGKFMNTKNNLGLNQNFPNDNFINLTNNQTNYSKSPPKDSFTINVNTNGNQILNKYGPAQPQQNKQQNKKFTNFENNSTSFNYIINPNKGYQTFYNIMKKDDIYNFDIDTNFEEKPEYDKQSEGHKKLGPAVTRKNINNLNPNGNLQIK